jgi:hypothetical protein
MQFEIPKIFSTKFNVAKEGMQDAENTYKYQRF